jgi:hypothetical protein
MTSTPMVQMMNVPPWLGHSVVLETATAGDLIVLISDGWNTWRSASEAVSFGMAAALLLPS